jgi:L-fuculose-phosphate aldolase
MTAIPSPPDRTAGYEAQVAELVAVGAQAVRSGLVVASGGNLSVRGPGPEQFTVTSRGSYLDDLGEHTLSVMTIGGDVVSGPEPSSEWRLHQQTYLARADAAAIVHVHPEYAVLVDAIGAPIRQLTLDHVAYAPRINRIPFYPNGSEELGRFAAEAAADADCVLLAHHGCSTVGSTPMQALRRAMNLEGAARATYRLLVLGDRSTEFPRDLRATAVHRG